jgi:putative mycofactocin binding protein MftB
MAFDPAGAYRLHPQVALRPEPFGALAYHYGNRKLVFLKTAKMVDVVRTLGDYSSVGDALAGAGIPAGRQPTYVQALADLERSEIICAATR